MNSRHFYANHTIIVYANTSVAVNARAEDSHHSSSSSGTLSLSGNYGISIGTTRYYRSGRFRLLLGKERPAIVALRALPLDGMNSLESIADELESGGKAHKMHVDSVATRGSITST